MNHTGTHRACFNFSQFESGKGGEFFSQLFLDYVRLEEVQLSSKRGELLRKFFSYDYQNINDLRQRCSDLSELHFDRKSLVSALKSQNTQWDCSVDVLENIEKLVSTKAFAVVTGQQVGIATGPLYTIYKAVSTVCYSNYLSSLFPEYQFVPIFWMEIEDHDFEEISNVTVFESSELKTLRYEEPNYQERQMVGKVHLSPAIASFISAFLQVLPKTEFYGQIETLLRNSYKEGVTLTDAFAKLFHKLFEGTGLVMMSPDDFQIKNVCKSIYKKELTGDVNTSAALIEKTALLEEMGYESQIKGNPINVFFIMENGKRTKIEKKQSRFVLFENKQSFWDYNLYDLLETSPDRFTSNVVLRPIVQDFILPTFGYVAGPSEINYFAQLRYVYEQFNMNMPIIFPRVSATLLEQKHIHALEKLKIYPFLDQKNESTKSLIELFFQNKDELTKTILAYLSNVNYESLFYDAEAKLKALLESVLTSLAHEPSDFKSFFAKSQEKMHYHLRMIRERLFQNELKKHEEILISIEKLYKTILPEKKLQERTINIFYYLAKYGGAEFIKLLHEEIQEMLKSQSIEKSQHIFIGLTSKQTSINSKKI